MLVEKGNFIEDNALVERVKFINTGKLTEVDETIKHNNNNKTQRSKSSNAMPTIDFDIDNYPPLVLISSTVSYGNGKLRVKTTKFEVKCHPYHANIVKYHPYHANILKNSPHTIISQYRSKKLRQTPISSIRIGTSRRKTGLQTTNCKAKYILTQLSYHHST